uniref:Selenoprotein H n=1 Tax=Mastacembelus armatus TaxID=205130 RepID=A0A3Q3KP04_9TELE
NVSSGRRGTKRKAEVQAEEEKPSVKEKKQRGEEENKQEVSYFYHTIIIGKYSMYGRNAEEVKSALLAAHPELTVVLNPEKPRRNSFEITLLDGDKETSLWTGIKKGPPRKLKFPQPDIVVAALQKALKVQ